MSWASFEDTLKQRFVSMNNTLADDMADNITNPIWTYPRDTLRSDGSIAGSPRDIVDTGELAGSQVSLPTSSTTFKHEWQAPHSKLAQVGYITDTGALVPARDWIAKALADKGLARRFRDESD